MCKHPKQPYISAKEKKKKKKKKTKKKNDEKKVSFQNGDIKKIVSWKKSRDQNQKQTNKQINKQTNKQKQKHFHKEIFQLNLTRSWRT